MSETVISWTAPNFVTIAIMMLISSAIIAAITATLVKRKGGSE